ncbi:MAG TPA: hypothetical protein VGR64_04255, partial [Terracidiphilus sp.]|nr:hypothetical protein [Terracidiphilus sp.]
SEEEEGCEERTARFETPAHAAVGAAVLESTVAAPAQVASSGEFDSRIAASHAHAETASAVEESPEEVPDLDVPAFMRRHQF